MDADPRQVELKTYPSESNAFPTGQMAVPPAAVGESAGAAAQRRALGPAGRTSGRRGLAGRIPARRRVRLPYPVRRADGLRRFAKASDPDFATGPILVREPLAAAWNWIPARTHRDLANRWRQLRGLAAGAWYPVPEAAVRGLRRDWTWSDGNRSRAPRVEDHGVAAPPRRRFEQGHAHGVGRYANLSAGFFASARESRRRSPPGHRQAAAPARPP